MSEEEKVEVPVTNEQGEVEKIDFILYKVPFTPIRWNPSPCDVCGGPGHCFHSGSTGEDAYLNGSFCFEHKPKRKLRIPETKEIIYFEGACDVCGEPLTMNFCFTTQGIIDYAYTKDNVMYTWRRHGKAGPNQPDCDIYSSRVYRVRSETVPLTEEDRQDMIDRHNRNADGWSW